MSFETMLLMMGSGAETLPAEHSARSCYGKFEQPQERRAGDSFLIRTRPEGPAGKVQGFKQRKQIQMPRLKMISFGSLVGIAGLVALAAGTS